MSNQPDSDNISHNSSNDTEQTDFTLAYCPICQTTGRKDHICSECDKKDITYSIPVVPDETPNSENHEDENFDIETQDDSDKDDQEDMESNSQNHDNIEDFLNYDMTEEIKSSKSSETSE